MGFSTLGRGLLCLGLLRPCCFTFKRRKFSHTGQEQFIRCVPLLQIPKQERGGNKERLTPLKSNYKTKIRNGRLRGAGGGGAAERN